VLAELATSELEEIAVSEELGAFSAEEPGVFSAKELDDRDVSDELDSAADELTVASSLDLLFS
jgi:hypothetical protein